ncbi:Protein of unknown function [Pyronema omphalodes CBS 100304]|uniref:Uncharacterized protein n=1 Tax=Pyronema omphalodes (strain CBS 100304) TaxID=1076935 RepID=U4LBB6_PYROM|nr:Protein of unknown function [Pyronema omphalodes CBS 100304]
MDPMDGNHFFVYFNKHGLS